MKKQNPIPRKRRGRDVLSEIQRTRSAREKGGDAAKAVKERVENAEQKSGA